MKKKYNLLSKEKIDKNLRICNNLKLFIIFLTTALLTWIIIDFAQDLKEINKSIIKNEPNNEYVILINEILITTKESLITNFIQNILIILIPSISVLISIFLIESNTNFIDEIDDTNEQIIDDFSSIDKTINNKF